MSGALIKAENLSFARNGTAILSDVSLEVGEGDFVSIVGPNGAGKSTLLKIFTGILAADSGVCRRKTGIKIGYMPQSINRSGSVPLSAERFVRLRHGGAGTDFRAVCRETGIGRFAGRSVGDLSGGEIQRVLLARALMVSPDVLVLDEPAQNLDVAGQIEFYKLLERIHRERAAAVLMVSHDLHMVMSSTKKVVCLYGHICCAGEPRSVAQDPEFVSMFGEDMARMVSLYFHTHEHIHDEPYRPNLGEFSSRGRAR